MTHLKKYWWIYAVIVILILLYAYQNQWFGNKSKLFCCGGAIFSPYARAGSVLVEPTK